MSYYQDEFARLLVKLIGATSQKQHDFDMVSVLQVMEKCQKEAIVFQEKSEKEFDEALDEFNTFCIDHLLVVPDANSSY